MRGFAPANRPLAAVNGIEEEEGADRAETDQTNTLKGTGHCFNLLQPFSQRVYPQKN